MYIMTVDYGHTFHFWDISRCICFYRSSLFIQSFHMFVLSDVLSASFSCIHLLEVLLSVVHFLHCTDWNIEHDIVSQIIVYLFYDILYIYWMYLYVFMYLSILGLYFFTYLSMFFNISRCMCKCEFIVYQVFE